jgi:hypothetical protein
MSGLPSEPEDYARALLNKFSLSRVDDLFGLASKIGLEIREVEPEGFEGAVVRKPNRPVGIIALKKDIREPGRRRFTIAHEIGHYILPNHGTQEYCSSTYIESASSQVPALERDANYFASELLMPASQIYGIVKRELASIATAKKVAMAYQVSLTAAAIKCVALTDERCALVQTTSGKIDWVYRGSTFGYFINKAQGLHPRSPACKLFEATDERELSESTVPSFWIEDISPDSKDAVWEDSIYLPYYNRVITILTITS